MESIDRTPDPAQAREALASIRGVQRAVRDTPWPTWLYPVNALLLGGAALTFLLEQHRLVVFTATVLLVVGVNVVAGYRMGAPWIVPTSRGFLAAVGTAGLCLAAAAVVADLPGKARLIPVLAVAAAVSYLVGAVVHRRSTRRPR